MDVNVEIDELVLDGGEDTDGLSDRIAAAAGGALSPDVAVQVSRAILGATSAGTLTGARAPGRRSEE